MNREKMIEAITTAILGKTAPKAAAAVLDLCGPEKLVWHKSDMSGWNGDYHTLPTAYTVRYADENGWRWSRWGYGAHGWEPSPEAAQAAAQSNADAAHWANTVIGAMHSVLKKISPTKNQTQAPIRIKLRSWTYNG